MKIKIPLWLTLVIVLETLPMFIGPYAALTRPGFMGGPEAETINQAAYIYAARNFAVGFAFLIASYLRSAPMLFILIFIRLFTIRGSCLSTARMTLKGALLPGKNC